MKQSPLHAHHQALGAAFETIGEWEIPAHYGDPIAEHLAVRNGLGIADLSLRGKIQVTGEDRVTWLQSIISNDILPLKPGQGLYSTFMTHKGKMLSYFRVYMLEDSVMVEDVGEIGGFTFQTFRKFLLYGTKAKMNNCLETWGILLVSGRAAGTLIQDTFDLDVTNLPSLSSILHPIGSHHALIVKTEETGELDFEILTPVGALSAAWDQLWAAGKSMGLRAFGTTARESLRVEAGIPKAGPDLNENIVPPEANLEGKAFSLTKGCYPGQEVVARMDTYGSVKRRLVGLVIETPDALVPPEGTKIYNEDRELGWVSSAVHSPTLKKTIAFGFPLRDFAKPDTELTVDIEGQRHRAVVQTLPFYSVP